MSNVNTATISGNVTRDPELRTFDSGTTKAAFAVAVNRRRKSGDEYVDDVSFIDVEAWGKFAELIGRKVRKGDHVTIQGRLEQQSWESDAGKRSKIVVVANEGDGAPFYKKDDEVAPLAEQAAAQPPLAEGATSAADDIPF